MGKKKRNLFSVFRQAKNSNVSEAITTSTIDSVADDGKSGAISKDFIFDQIKMILLNYRVELLKTGNWQNNKATCSNCQKALHEMDNMIVLTDCQGNYYGLNGYYCSSCHIIFIDEEELSSVKKEISGKTVKVGVLSNYERKLKNEGIEIVSRQEAKLRDLLDKMNELNENKTYSIYKQKTMPIKCPVCDRAFTCSDSVITIYRNGEAQEYTIRGWYCKYCGVLYVEEDSLLKLIAAGIKENNILRVIIDDLSEQEKRVINQLANDLSAGKTLYIHRGNIICKMNHHHVISVTAIVPAVNLGRSVQININYCLNCDKCFISEIVYEQYRNSGELPAINLGRVKANGNYPSDHEIALAEESPLHLLGYNVTQADDFSDEYRQKLLGKIMDCGVLSKYKVSNYLERFIANNRNRQNMKLAVSKWESDLRFVQHYHIQQQEQVKIISVRPYEN